MHLVDASAASQTAPLPPPLVPSPLTCNRLKDGRMAGSQDLFMYFFPLSFCISDTTNRLTLKEDRHPSRSRFTLDLGRRSSILVARRPQENADPR